MILKFRHELQAHADRLKEVAGTSARLKTPSTPCTDTGNIKAILNGFSPSREGQLKRLVDADLPDVPGLVDCSARHLGARLPDLWSLKKPSDSGVPSLFPIDAASADGWFPDGSGRRFLDRGEKPSRRTTPC